jgi:GNAT superfamily N-acetyltransferase
MNDAQLSPPTRRRVDIPEPSAARAERCAGCVWATIEESESRSDEEWIQRAGEIAACPEREVLFIARDGKIPCGTVYLRLESGITELYAMWVDPAFRRRHVGSALLERPRSPGRGIGTHPRSSFGSRKGTRRPRTCIDARVSLARARKMSCAQVQRFGFRRWCINLESDTSSALTHVDMRP